MNLREEIQTILKGWQNEVTYADETEDLLIELFKKWALEMVGEDLLSQEMPYDENTYNWGVHNTKSEIRRHIEETTK